MAKTPTVNILMVEDNPGDAALMHALLTEEGGSAFAMEHVARLTKAVGRLATGDIDLILLDLGLPDSYGLNTVRRVMREAPDTPIVVLTGLDDHEVALQSVREGAQDYLVKGNVDGKAVVRAIQYAVERHKQQAAAQHEYLTDDLTGLLNRRGFMTLASQQLQVAQRGRSALSVTFLDLDNLKQINDEYGHSVGNQALTEVAAIVRDTTRESDIVARIGGDEFVALLLDPDSNGVTEFLSRFHQRIEDLQKRPKSKYTLSVSAGVAYFDPESPLSLEELISEADKSMYYEKRRRKTPPGNVAVSDETALTG